MAGQKHSARIATKTLGVADGPSDCGTAGFDHLREAYRFEATKIRCEISDPPPHEGRRRIRHIISCVTGPSATMDENEDWSRATTGRTKDVNQIAIGLTVLLRHRWDSFPYHSARDLVGCFQSRHLGCSERLIV